MDATTVHMGLGNDGGLAAGFSGCVADTNLAKRQRILACSISRSVSDIV